MLSRSHASTLFPALATEPAGSPAFGSWFFVGNGGMGFWDYSRGPEGTIIEIHSPIPY